jgi:hypothetical protein
VAPTIATFILIFYPKLLHFHTITNFMKTYTTLLWLCLIINTHAQLQDDFSDGDHLNLPTWKGDTEHFKVSDDKKLQLFQTAPGGSIIYADSLNFDLDEGLWRFELKQSFSGSANNRSKVFLLADTASNQISSGIYLLFGEAGSLDAIRLIQIMNGVETELAKGEDSEIAASFDAIIEVRRDQEGNWTVSYSFDAGNLFTFQFTGQEISYPVGGVFLWDCKYTSSNAQKFYLDNVFVGNEIRDTKAPIITSFSSTKDRLFIDFDEELDSTETISVSNYVVNNEISIDEVIFSNSSHQSIELAINGTFQNNSNYQLTILQLQDTLGNDTTNVILDFFILYGEEAEESDVVINEMMVDPSPSVGLPEAEYIELYNKSDKIFNLQGWEIADALNNGVMDEFWLFPGENLILCNKRDTLLFACNRLGLTNFPGLNNSGDKLTLYSNNGMTIDEVDYSASWYGDDFNEDGGVSLERKDLTLKCSDNRNWSASTSPIGGTPGERNSIFTEEGDLKSPDIVGVSLDSNEHLVFIFDEEVDLMNLEIQDFLFAPELTITSIITQGEMNDSLTVLFNTILQPSSTYQFTLLNIKDCEGNTGNSQINYLRPHLPRDSDVFINELYFNPPSFGFDFVEIVNTTNNHLDMTNCGLANITNGQMSVSKPMTLDGNLLPNQILALTEDPVWLSTEFMTSPISNLVMQDLPTMPNDSGTLILVCDNIILDKVSYSADWHHPLINEEEGKSLEKLSPALSSMDPKNWHTASSTVRFATPGLSNSQLSGNEGIGEFSLSSPSFSPDNDGFEDFLQINYKMVEPENILSITIYDVTAKETLRLLESQLIGNQGFVTWNGVDAKGNKASIGQYVLVFELLNTKNGEVKYHKTSCILAGRLN